MFKSDVVVFEGVNSVPGEHTGPAVVVTPPHAQYFGGGEFSYSKSVIDVIGFPARGSKARPDSVRIPDIIRTLNVRQGSIGRRVTEVAKRYNIWVVQGEVAFRATPREAHVWID